MTAADQQQEPEQETIATTIAQAAEHFGVSTRTFANWTKTPGFPGQAGSPGKQDGHFPLQQIERWKELQPKKGGISYDDEETSIRREMLQLDRDKKRAEYERDYLGTLIDAEEVLRFNEFIIAAAKQHLQELPDTLLAKLPSKLKPKLVRIIRRAAMNTAHEVLETLTQLISGDSDEREDEE